MNTNTTILLSILIGLIFGASAAGLLSRVKKARWNGALGVLCAMDEEAERFRRDMRVEETRVISGIEYRCGTLLNKRIVIARCGMGKVNAAVCTQTLCREFGVSRLMNIGVAGGADPALRAGDVLVSQDAVQHDYHTIGCEPGRVLYQNTVFFPADERLRELAMSICDEAGAQGIRILQGRVATGDVFVDSADMRGAIRSMFGASIVEMEGAAMAQTAADNGVPWLILRAVSDDANGDSTREMQKNLDTAAENLYWVVRHMLPNMR